MKSNSSNGQLTAQINIGDHKKSGFDLSHNVLGTGRIGRIIPTRALHVMPGDTIKADSKCAVQFEPLAVPILANMDVKQEHFYVPYNVVWQNWDKFISGGEKMDYKGVVPNHSMYDIISAIMDIFSKHFTLTGKYGDIRFDNGGGLQYDFKAVYITNDMYYNPPYSSHMSDEKFVQIQQYMLDRLETIGDTYQIKDILQTQKYLIEKVLPTLTYNPDNVSHAVDTAVFVRIPRLDMNSTPAEAVAKAREMYEYLGVSGNKYMETLFDYIVGLFLDEEKDVFILTDYGVRVFRFMYDMIKPFVGLSSNMDYLGMRVVTFEDYLMSQLMYANEVYAGNNYANGDEFVFRTVDYGYSQEPMSFLNLRANYSIWYNNYRDILLESGAQEPVTTDNVSDLEIFTLLVPRQRCWQKDAFTTALDNPATGNVGVPVSRDNLAGSQNMVVTEVQEIGVNQLAKLGRDNDMEIAEIMFNGEKWQIPTAYLSGNSPIESVGQEVSGFSLYSLDAAQRAQKFIQKALFYGNRINDFYNIRFGVKYLDARLRLPELLTSSSELVGLQVVMNNTNITTEAGGEIYQSIAGDRAAYASAYDNGNSFDRFCEEHGVIMSFLTVMPQVTYAYGIDRDYSRLDQFDFAFPEFATLGMDAVYDSEITSSAINVNKSQVFGYQGKYYDYKAKHSREHGELLDSQDMYTFARHYNMLIAGKAPKLNYEFVHCFPDLDMFVVNNPLDDYFRYDIRHSTAAERELPAQSIYI